MRQTTSIKLDKTIKQEAQKVFSELGLTLGEAVNLFLNQVRLHKGLPFEVKIPNAQTLQAMKDIEEGINIESITLEDHLEEMKKCIKS
jgi:DNA-damage-inducible protein J